MNIPVISSYEEKAADTVVSVLNAAKEALGERQTLKQLATSRDVVSPRKKVVLSSLKCPIPVTSEQLIRNTIEKTWKLTETFMYTLKYTGSTTDECSQYYYFEAVFSQPTAQYPIPQATVSVFFRVEDKQIEPPGVGRVPVVRRSTGNNDNEVISSYEEKAADTVVSVLNAAKEALGERQTLKQLATSRDVVSPRKKVVLSSLKCPIPVTSEQLIRNTIEKTWKLTETFMYTLKYTGSTTDECSQYYYFEAVFSQPTAQYPIPQATVSVFFRVEDKQIVPPGVGRVPVMKFRIEGHRWDLDVRHVLLIPEWLLAVLQMKMKFYRRIEEIRLF